MKLRLNKLFRYSSLGLLALLSSHAYAAGYKMEFQSASVLADAGEAAVVEDASTNWYNSAGLTSLPQQLVLTAFDVYAPVRFSGTTIAPSPFGSTFFATGNASSHPNVVLPSFHYTVPIASNWSFGLSLAPAWGFAEDYGAGSIVRYNLIRINTRTMDVEPSIAWQINKQWSVGLGPDAHYFSVLSRLAARTEGPAVFGGTAGDSMSRYDAHDWAYGGHIGFLYRPNDGTRFGINYRSQLTQHLKGGSEFLVYDGPVFSSNDFELDVPLPAVTTLSGYHEIDAQWAVMGTVAYDAWSRLNTYHAENYQAGAVALPDVFLPQHMRDTVDVSLGAHYTVDDQVMLRGSIKYLPTPVNDKYRGVNFPDGRKIGLNAGARYQYNAKLAFDLMAGYVFVKQAHINDINPITFATATGHSQTHIDLVGAQVVWKHLNS